jgi:hypothetical protein
MKILSIDIGIVNLGFVFVEINDFKNIYKSDYITNKEQMCKNIIVLKCDRVNITTVNHNSVKWCDCKLHHEKCIPDYLDHFVQEYQEMFDSADVIIIERQPPIGITNVQDLLFVKFRKKVKLISPNSVHKYFGQSTDYPTRKLQSERITDDYLLQEYNYSENIRKHDISDAMLMILYFYNTLLKKKCNCLESFEFLEKFRYY